MSSTPGPDPGGIRYGTRWGRTLLAMLPALAAVGGIGTAVGQGVWAAGYTAQATTSALSVAEMTGGPAAIVATAESSRAFDGSDYQHPILRIGLSQARVREVCVTQRIPLPGRPMTLRIEIPAGAVRGLIVDAEVAAGGVAMTGDVAVNVDGAAATVPGLPAAMDGAPGDLGIVAQGLELRGALVSVRTANIGAAGLSGMTIRLEEGATECPPPAGGG